MQGFDYRQQRHIDKSTSEWREDLHEAISNGGFRRVEHGETFAHDRAGKILFEVYGNVQISRTA